MNGRVFLAGASAWAATPKYRAALIGRTGHGGFGH